MPECDPDRLTTPQAFLHGQLLALDFLLGARHAILTEFLHFYKKLGAQAMALERRGVGWGCVRQTCPRTPPAPWFHPVIAGVDSLLC